VTLERRLITLAIDMRSAAGAMQDEAAKAKRRSTPERLAPERDLDHHASELRGAAEIVDAWVVGLEGEEG